MLAIFTGRRRFTAAVAVAATVAGLATALAPSASAADLSASVSPVLQRTPGMVTADALPTVQIDGVVWSNVTVGNTVYAGGNFTNARPAGAAAGTSQTPRSNLLSFDLTTGNLITSFAPTLNGQVKYVTKSPDGSKIYVGGSFTQVNGINHYRLAAFDAVTGALLPWSAGVDATVNAITVTNNAVYVGGAFGSSGGQTRSKLAAFDPNTGALLGWAPSADATVNAMVATPDGSRVIVGGSFQNVNGAPAYGLAAILATDGTLVPWAASSVVQDAGPSAAILSLKTDGTSIYSTAYVYGTGGNFEGVMSADPDTGNINWLDDCHGDTYDTFASPAAVYVVSHQHYCSNIGGFPDTNPRTIWHRSTAYTLKATGLVQPNGEAGGGYGNFAGQPSPSLYDWLPDIDVGSFTGQNQGSWSASGNSQYLVEGGEFLHVNNTAQQGLVRFAVPSIAPNKQGLRLDATKVPVSAVARSSTSARITWGANWDRDDMLLNYAVSRNSVVVKTLTAASTSWNLPMLGFIDTGLSPGQTYTYRVKGTDSSGNAAVTSTFTVTTPTTDSGPDGAYVKDVLNQGASDYWRLDQATGATTQIDYAGFNDLTLNAGVTGGVSGAINDGNSASAFNAANSGLGVTATPIDGPNTFSEEVWFQTTSKTGGKLVGFGDKNTGLSSNYDRHIYMLGNGQLAFGVYNNASYTVTTSKAYNDGVWHQAVATLGSNGMSFYVDGRLIGVNTGTVVGQRYSGYWRVGGDSSWSGAAYFTGNLDDVSIYPTVLTGAQVRQQYIDSGRTVVGGTAPADAYGASVWNASPYLYYRLDDTTGKAAVDLSGNGNDGTYGGTVQKGQSTTVTTTGTSVNFTGSGTVGSNSAMAGPNTYTEQVWFNTTSSTGGKLIGFGDSQTGTSSNYDRHVYMQPNGQLVFGTYNGQINVATSPLSYNDGKWHQVTATQGPDGMSLYVDAQLVATNATTTAQGYNGYWRLGGDNLNSWPGGATNNFTGRLDEAAVYLSELSQSTIRGQYLASPAANATPPTAAFTSSTNGATVSFDATGSSDAFGTITSYSWDFGDGSSGSGATVAHKYAVSGTYSVTLTVTDDRSASSFLTKSVVVTIPNQPPTAAFNTSATNLSVSVDATASSDPDGTVASYAWDFGDGQSGTGVKASHVYSAGGTYTISLTVTDDKGATATTTHDVTVNPPNQAPTASFTSGVSALQVSLDGSKSSDADGTVVGYAWNFGDGATGSGATATHTYATGGTYTVSLTVTDDRGGTGTVSHDVTVNAPPKASFTSSASGLVLSVDGSASKDPDGTIASWAWNFGDGGSATTPTAGHTYGAPGTYTVTLTVTDDKGATDTATKSVTVVSTVASDAFGRTASNGWGTADVGGTWTVANGTTNFAVDGTTGRMTLPAASATPLAVLKSVNAQNVNALVSVGLDKLPTGSGSVVMSMIARRTASGDYRLRLKFLPGGVLHLGWSKVVAGKETVIAEKVVNPVYNVGDVLKLRFTLSSNAANTSTALTGSVWTAGTAEPTTPQITATDTESVLQAPGQFGLQSWASSTTTNTPIVVSFDDLLVSGI